MELIQRPNPWKDLIPDGAYAEMEQTLSNVWRKGAKAYENFILGIITKELGREVDLEKDKGRVQIIHQHGNFEDQMILIDGKPAGTIHKVLTTVFDNNFSAQYTFEYRSFTP